MPIMVHLNAAALPLVWRWPRSPIKYAAPYVKRCDATAATRAGQSRLKRSTGSPAVGANAPREPSRHATQAAINVPAEVAEEVARTAIMSDDCRGRVRMRVRGAQK